MSLLTKNKYKNPFQGNIFLATYRTSFITLIRSPLFWAALLILIAMVASRVLGRNYGYVKILDDGSISNMIYDTDPEYVLEYKVYIQVILNLRAWMMIFQVPIFCIITTFVMLNRNHSDHFFEIERSTGLRNVTYLFARFLAVFTVCLLSAILVAMVGVTYYYFSRGGLAQFTTMEFFADAMPRVIRQVVCSFGPAILFYISLAYVVGTLVRNAYAGGVAGIGYVLLHYRAQTTWRMAFPQYVHDYLTPCPSHANNYFAWIDTEWFTETTIHNPFSPRDFVIYYSIIFSVIVVFLALSYWSTAKRTR